MKNKKGQKDCESKCPLKDLMISVSCECVITPDLKLELVTSCDKVPKD